MPKKRQCEDNLEKKTFWHFHIRAPNTMKHLFGKYAALRIKHEHGIDFYYTQYAFRVEEVVVTLN